MLAVECTRSELAVGVGLLVEGLQLCVHSVHASADGVWQAATALCALTSTLEARFMDEPVPDAPKTPRTSGEADAGGADAPPQARARGPSVGPALSSIWPVKAPPAGASPRAVQRAAAARHERAPWRVRATLAAQDAFFEADGLGCCTSLVEKHFVKLSRKLFT